MVSTESDRSAAGPDVRTPSVLVVLVVRDAVRWLRDCLQSLAAQTYPRLGVLAVDNASMDGSREMLEQALGAGRVISLSDNRGVAGSVRAALEVPAAQGADYLLILHDDTALAPDAVVRMVEAAEGIRGVERVGVVGPKVVDWDDPRILREVGRSTDRLGHPYTPLQEGEMDHGQYDRVLEVLFVSSCAMLISRSAVQRTGLFDERLASHYDDLDFCWRARLAGFRVLMTPLAKARHRGATQRGDRPETRHRRSSRYYAERAALAAMLKNYGVFSLAWLLPLHFVLGVSRLAVLVGSRQLEDAYELFTAWNWNLVHLPGTIRRRIRVQSVRTVPDRSVRRFMGSATLHLPRWFEAVGAILAEQRELRREEEEEVAVRVRATSLARAHPVLVGWVLAIVVGALAYRGLLGPEPLQGGVLPSFPAEPGGFFRELFSAARTSGLGGTQAGSPALAVLGGGSAVLGASTGLGQKVFLAAMPLLAAVLLYRVLFRQTKQRAAAVIGGTCYALSAAMFWAFSEGRIGLLAALAVLPAVMERVDAAFGPAPPRPRWRFVVGAGMAVAFGVAFFPGTALPIGVLLVVHLLAGRRRGLGIVLSVLFLLVGAALVFPMVPDLAADGGASLSSSVGGPDFAHLARLAPGTGPGAWPVAWFLPAAALLGFSVVEKRQRGRAYRAMLAAVAGLFLAWASTAGYLPEALSNPSAYVALSAVSEAALVGYGLAAVVGVGRRAFGYRQIGAAGLAVVLTAGLALQSVEAARGAWAIGPNRLPAAWPAVGSDVTGGFRILWLGRAEPLPFPAPGGDPQGTVDAGPSSVRFAITDRAGVTALDVGRGSIGPGYGYADRVLTELLSGATSTAGALLAPLGVRYVVAAAGDLPRPALERLDAQLDLDLLPAGGLVIYRNARVVPPAAAIPVPGWRGAAERGDLLTIESLPDPHAIPLPATTGGWRGTGAGSGGLVLLADQFAPAWRLVTEAGSQAPLRAFGWATGFDLPAGAFTITYSRQWVRTGEVLLLLLLWLAALWITRKPVSR